MGFTVFAPNNEAFAAIPSDDLNALLAETAQLKEVILYHVLAAEVLSMDLSNGEQKVDTASGGALWVTKSSSGVTVANSDRSIVANVIAADNMANNGVAHIIDAVLLPPKPMPSLAGLVTSVDDLSTLLTAVDKAGLVDTLSGAGTFTVFAPNNEAFAAIPSDILNALLADTDDLKEVILYHVLAAEVLSMDLKSGEQKVETASGGALWVTKSSSGVTVANSDRSIVANVIAADNMANNGVAHIIDAVLLPPVRVDLPTVTSTQIAPVLPDGSAGSDAVDDSASSGSLSKKHHTIIYAGVGVVVVVLIIAAVFVVSRRSSKGRGRDSPSLATASFDNPAYAVSGQAHYESNAGFGLGPAENAASEA